MSSDNRMLVKELFGALATELQGVFHETNDAADEWLDRFTEKQGRDLPRKLKTTQIQHGDEIHDVPHAAFAHPSNLQMKRICMDLDLSLDNSGELAVQLDGRSKDKHTARVHIEMERVDAAEGQHKLIAKIDNKFFHQHHRTSSVKED